MAVNEMPKYAKYYLIYDGGQLEIEKDPRGWEDNVIGISRDDNFGLNTQNVVELSFVGKARKKLKELYDQKSAYTKCNVRIEKRQNDWTLLNWYEYRLDFKQYADNGREITISGIEDGLLSKFQKFADTEYEIILPNNKRFLSYTGVTKYKKNLLQCSYGSIQDYERSNIGEDYYALGATRSVRTYSEKLSFTYTNGTPYKTMTVRALSDVTFDLDIHLKCKIEVYGFGWFPSSGFLKIIKHDANYNKIGDALLTIPPLKSSGGLTNKRKDEFDYVGVLSVSLLQDQLITVFYDADYGGILQPYTSVNVTDGYNAYISIGANAESSFKEQRIEVFTYEWLIEQIIKKIHPDSIFVSELEWNDYMPLLSATPCIVNMGDEEGSGKLKYNLKDVLNSLDLKKMISIDFDGNIFTLKPRKSAYLEQEGYSVECKDIIVKHQSEHQYKKITVGSNVDDSNSDEITVYPVNVNKTFEVSDCEFDGELDLSDKFMIDPYDIDQYIENTVTESSTKDECKFVVFAATPLGLGNKTYQATSNSYISFEANQPIYFASKSGYPDNVNKRIINIQFDDPSGSSVNYFLNSTNSLFNFTPSSDGVCYIVLRVNIFSNLIGDNLSIITDMLFPNNEVHEIFGAVIWHKTTNSHELNISYKVIVPKNTTYSPTFQINSIVALSDITFNDFYVNVVQWHELYQDHVISNFKGNVATMYNIPLTPKRTLMQYASYIKLSTFGNNLGKLNFLTSTFKNTAITSRCGYETEDVVEESDFQISTEPIFLPATIQFSGHEVFKGMQNLKDNKYKYVTIKNEKTGKTYTGWINDFTFSVAKGQQQDYILQARTL